MVVNGKNTYKNLAQLSMWGVVYMESNGAGFAMEFVGDMADSRIAGNLGELKAGSRVAAGSVGSQTIRPGAGIIKMRLPKFHCYHFLTYNLMRLTVAP
jgi:hypothetical protein